MTKSSPDTVKERLRRIVDEWFNDDGEITFSGRTILEAADTILAQRREIEQLKATVHIQDKEAAADASFYNSETTKLREALKTYGKHKEDCIYYNGKRLGYDDWCNCGLYATLHPTGSEKT